MDNVWDTLRRVPLVLKHAVEATLDRLEQAGVLEKVCVSEWATPLVMVPKKNGHVRLCGDYRITINPAMDVKQYSLPCSEDLFATLARGKWFTILDLTNTYYQVLLNETSQNLVTINTHWGLYRYNRVLFGALKTPPMCQKTMDTIL